MKKILIFIDWYLPGYRAGGPIRSVANMVAHLSDRYQFLVVTRDTDYMDPRPYKEIESNNWNKISDNHSVYYISKDTLSIKKIKEIIKATDFDIVYINGVYSFYFSILPLVLMRYFYSKTSIVAPRGMLSEQGLGVKSRRKKLFVMIARIFGLYKKSIIHITGNTERPDIENLHLKPRRICYALNFPPFAVLDNQNKCEKTSGKLKLVFIARIAPEKNLLFALKCLQNTEYKGHIDFDIYGAIYHQDYWNICNSLIKDLPENIQVNYHGQLDNNQVSEVLQKHHFTFLPTKGESFGHSILESFTAGCPVIISDQTPWKDLKDKHIGWDISLDNIALFTSTIQFAIDLNQQQYKQMSDKAAEFARNYFDLPQIVESYTTLFE